jgi:hypothetical protein
MMRRDRLTRGPEAIWRIKSMFRRGLNGSLLCPFQGLAPSMVKPMRATMATSQWNLTQLDVARGTFFDTSDRIWPLRILDMIA